eukprot:9472542-Pyramimonas_sp.AAC.1
MDVWHLGAALYAPLSLASNVLIHVLEPASHLRAVDGMSRHAPNVDALDFASSRMCAMVCPARRAP